MAMPPGPFNPEISAEFTVAPAVVYSPIVPLAPQSFGTNRSEPEIAMPVGAQPRDQRGVHRRPGGGVFADRASSDVCDKQIRARDRNARRVAQPRDQRGVHRRPGGGVFADRAGVLVRDKQIRAGQRNAPRVDQPRDQRGVLRFISSPHRDSQAAQHFLGPECLQPFPYALREVPRSVAPRRVRRAEAIALFGCINLVQNKPMIYGYARVSARRAIFRLGGG